ncbi:SusC/RagA family TonB-linked outer membrane protein [Pedobacter sp. KBW01]|uniref:SusC/RagA family TonB-linked outer membrane protein n=1 Tax=Pedobacter sp. KBW01 TaxID=2153364 RepID=UPI000F5A6BD4|nr:SusC/RagA family TonB-linked outer membrane protein [Pedobacter sp. KBW01]RQO77787.1 SusC/RagA family TonB-linked outer membrane protein [Pedobacter sp. KBW01]
MKNSIFLIVLAALCLFSKAKAQSPKTLLSGRVSSASDGKPLSGATLKINGTAQFTQTDASGYFSFTLNNANTSSAPSNPAPRLSQGSLTVSFTGYRSKTIPFDLNNSNSTESNGREAPGAISGQDKAKKDLENLANKAKGYFLLIQLVEDPNTLADVQINAGYYTVKDRERTGTITKISAQTIANQPVSNPLAALQGRVAGLVVTQRNGLPGSDFAVQLRGRSSIQSGTSPLYLVDGVPFPSETVAQSSTIFANSPLNSINPSDIESIEVLKDADATAIYGSRGANGVILITTKKGRSGDTKAEFSLSTGFGRVTRQPEMMGTEQYLQMRREAFANDKVTPTLANAPDLLGWDNNRYQDFADIFIGGAARTTQGQLRLSGGNSSTTYALSAGYYRETTVFPGETGLSKKDAQLSLTHRSMGNRFTLNVSAGYGSSLNRLYRDDLSGSITAVPNSPALYDSNGRLTWLDNGISFSNPMAKVYEPNDFRTYRFNGNAVAGYRILPGLELKLSSGLNAVSVNQYAATPIIAQNPSGAPTGSANFGDNTSQTWSAEPQLNYALDLKSYGQLSMLAGATWQGSFNRGSIIQASGYTNDLLIGSAGSAVTREGSNTYADYRYQALFARINYNLAGKYLLNLTGRRDGSSRFGPERRFASFGAVGAAWVFSQEDWLQQGLPFLSFGKLRGSYGITGNDQISNYQFLDSYISSPVYGGQTGLYPNRLFNDSYGWETSRKLEANLELGFLKDRIRISAGLFRNISGNQLVAYSLPGQTGFGSVLRNLDARIENRGLELELNTVNLKGRFSWSTSANLTFTRNRLLEFPGLASSSYASSYFIGQPLGMVLGYHYTGISQVTGAYTFEDKNGDGLYNTQDYYQLGTREPRFYGGISNTVRWQGFSLDVFFQFARQLGTDMVYGSATLIGSRNNVPALLLDRWTPENPNARYQAYTQMTSGALGAARSLIRLSDAALVDASFIRLKNMAFAYEIPSALASRLRLRSARLSLQGQNLWTLTPYEGIDPESQSASTLPPLRMISFGLQLTL